MLPDERALYERVLLQLRVEEEGRASRCAGSSAQERYPDLHERQIEENNRHWAGDRERRVEKHVERVREHLQRCSRGKLPGEATNGRKQKVWCVELRQCFDSLSQAARLAGSAPGNVLRSIRIGVRCGAFHWERFDPARHHPEPPPPPAAAPEGRPPCAENGWSGHAGRKHGTAGGTADFSGH